MPALDAYVRQMVQHRALEAELLSNERARITVESGDIRTKKVITHDEVSAIVHGAAPASAKRSLMTSGRASFSYAVDGIVVTVMVDARRPDAWSVQLLPHGTPSKPPAAGNEDTGFTDPPPPGKAPGAPEGATAEAIAARASNPPGARGNRPSSVHPPPIRLDEGEPRIHQYLRAMAKLGASDLHLSSGVPPMVRHDGEMCVLGDGKPMTDTGLRKMIGEIAGPPYDEEFAKLNDTDFAHAIDGVARFRVNAFVDRHGAGVVCRRIPFEILTLEQLGLPKAVKDLCWLSKGLVVVTGPTGSGKSTTLASIVDYINRNRSDHVITIEDPVEFVHENKRCLINQREVKTHTQGFASGLRAALREDPDIVLVGEMRDLETISIAIETAETGHLVFGTLHTTTAISTVDRIIDQFPADRQAQVRVMLSESLSGVIAQVLCKKPGGGRKAAYEILLSTSAVANLIREGKTFQIASTMQTSRNLGMQTMNEHLVELVKTGQVAPEEAYVKAVDKTGLRMAFNQQGISLDLEEAPSSGST